MAAIVKNILMLTITAATLFEILACLYSFTTRYYFSRKRLRNNARDLSTRDGTCACYPRNDKGEELYGATQR